MVAPEALIMLEPSKSALLVTVAIWSRRDLKSSFKAERADALSEVSEAARAFSFICDSRSETVSPAEMATSMVDWPRCSDDLTEFRALDCERCDWAMAQMAPLSLAEATFLPVLMRA